MDKEKIENDDSQNVDEEVETSEEETTTEDSKEELTDREKQFLARAKKAESKLKSQKEEKVEKKPKEDKSNEFGLVEKGYLKAAGISDADEIDLAKKLMEETGKELDVLIESKYFKSELKELQDAKATAKATSGVKGGTGSGSKATENPEYWIAKGVPPTKNDVPDRKVRVKIHRAMMKNSRTGGKKFYND